MPVYHAFRRYPDLFLAGLFALGAGCLAPPASAEVLACLNLPLLGLLLFLMSIVAGLRQSGFFAALFQRLFKGRTSGRSLSRFFIFSCYFSSMLITNDVALIVFVPLAIMTFTEARRIRLIVPTVCWQTIAANLGSMLTPVGNPQNLFIYSHYGLSPWDFFAVTAPVVLISGVVIYLSTFTLPEVEVDLSSSTEAGLPWKKIVPLLLGVNIGGLGTIIASMASVISFKAYLGTRFSRPGYYLLTFTGSNLLVLALLLGYYKLYVTA